MILLLWSARLLCWGSLGFGAGCGRLRLAGERLRLRGFGCGLFCDVCLTEVWIAGCSPSALRSIVCTVASVIVSRISYMEVRASYFVVNCKNWNNNLISLFCLIWSFVILVLKSYRCFLLRFIHIVSSVCGRIDCQSCLAYWCGHPYLHSEDKSFSKQHNSRYSLKFLVNLELTMDFPW